MIKSIIKEYWVAAVYVLIFIIGFTFLSLWLLETFTVTAQTIDESYLPIANEYQIADVYNNDTAIVTGGGLDILISNVSVKDEDVLEVFIQAYDGDQKIGFGGAGTLETERLIIVNPPILVPDGTTTEICSAELIDVCWNVNNYVEDAEKALAIIAEDFVNLYGRYDTDVVEGSVGNTVTVFYPSNDGHIYKNNSTDWATTRDATTGTTVINDTTNDSYPITGHDGAPFIVGRYGMYVDFTALGTDTVNSATFNIKSYGKDNDDNDGDDYIVLTSFNSSSTTDWITAEFDNFGIVALSDTIDISSVTTNTFSTFTLNATGLARITAAGSYWGLREGHDMIDSPYSGGDNTFNYVGWYYKAQTGTTDDPYFSVTHTASTPPPDTASSTSVSVGMIVINRQDLWGGVIILLIISNILLWVRQQ